MLLQRLTGVLLLASSTAHAFKDAAPFFVLSQKSLSNDALKDTQIATASEVEVKLLSTLTSSAHCNDALSNILVQQPGVKASDITKESMPKLFAWLSSTGQAPRPVEQVSVPEVLGTWDLEGTSEKLAQQCDASLWREEEVISSRDSPRKVMSISLDPLNMGMNDAARAKKLRETDEKLDNLLTTRDQYSGVIVFSGSRKSAQPTTESELNLPYEMDEPYPSPMHTDLKRDLEMHRRNLNTQRQSNGTDNTQTDLPLFEKYQFLSPALFMGLSVSILLLVILYVGVTAIAGLQVSYAAFSKEMGPQAQKGKQQ